MTRTVEHLKVMVVDDHQDGAEALGQVLAVMGALERVREAAAIAGFHHFMVKSDTSAKTFQKS